MTGEGNLIGTMEAPSLYDIVKKTIYELWLNCLRLQIKINKQRAQFPVHGAYPGEIEFRTGLIALWRTIEFKLQYHPEAECVKKLKEVEATGIFSGKDLDKIKLETLEEVFRHMTAFLEEDGITRFERKKARSDLEIIEGLDEPGDF